MRYVLLFPCALAAATSAQVQDSAHEANVPIRVVRDGIPEPLSRSPGNAERGRTLMVERAAANCLLCHALPGAPVAGNVGPSLADIAKRLSGAQIRLRIADIQLVKRDAVMPSYYRIERLDRVAAEYRGKPVLNMQQVEDLVAYLETLR